jgi:hypothetical protein
MMSSWYLKIPGVHDIAIIQSHYSTLKLAADSWEESSTVRKFAVSGFAR